MKPVSCEKDIVILSNGCALELSLDYGQMSVKEAKAELVEINKDLPKGSLPWRFAGGGTLDVAVKTNKVNISAGYYFCGSKPLEWKQGMSDSAWREIQKGRDEGYCPYEMYFTSFDGKNGHSVWAHGDEAKKTVHVRFVRNVPGYFNVSKTVTIGIEPQGSLSPETTLAKVGRKVRESARGLLGSRTLHMEGVRRPVDLVSVTLADLGFTDTTSREAVYERAQILGLVPCPDEVILSLCIEWTLKDQPYEGEIATRPLTYSHYDPDTLGISTCSGKAELHVEGGQYGYLGRARWTHRKFLFEKPRK